MNRLISVLLVAVSSLSGQSKKIVVNGLDEANLGELRAANPNVRIVGVDADGLGAQIGDADGLISQQITRQELTSAHRLKWMQTFSAGVEGVAPLLKGTGITLTNCKIIQGPEIADHAMALLLALTRGLYRTIPARTTEHLARNIVSPIELRGKTAVVVGLGGIGTQISLRANAFGMTVIGVDPKDIPFLPFVSRVVKPGQIDTVLPLADVIFISAPLTPQSEGMIGEKQFQEMKKSAYFIAVSRGKLYSTGALVKALDSRSIAGAGLDVTNPEPLPPGHPLWKFENALITPHIAGQSDGVMARRVGLFKENIRRFTTGEPMLNVVDVDKGY